MTKRVVGDVAVRVGADVGPLKIGLQDAGRRVDRFGRKASRIGPKLAKAARVGVFAITAMAAGISAAAIRAISSLDAIGKKSAQIGITAEALQELAFAAKSAGVSSSALNSSLERFSKRLGEAEQGFGAARKQLEFLNLSVEELTDMPLDSALEVVADRLADIEDPAARAAAAAGLFGREGVAMVNMLKEGGDALAETRREARDFGAVVSNEAVASAEEFEDKLGRLTDGIRSQLYEALIEVGPLIIGMANAALEASFFINDLAEKVGNLATNVKAVIDAGRTGGGRGLLEELTNGKWAEWFPEPYNPNVTTGDPLQRPEDGNDLLPPTHQPGGPLRLNIADREEVPDRKPNPFGPGESTGGGGRRSPIADLAPSEAEIEGMMERFKTARELITQEYEEQLKMLDAFYADKEGKEAEHAERRAQIISEMNDELARLRQQEFNDAMASTQELFNSLGQAMGEGGKKLVKIAGVIGATQAWISTLIGAAKELEKGTFGFAQAAAVLAKGAAFVAAIKSTTNTEQPAPVAGGGSAGGAGGNTIAAQEEQAQQQRSLTLIGDNFNRRQAMRIAEFMNEGTDDGLVIRGR